MPTATLGFDYSGADVLVTGGTSGIGHAIALAYRDAGANVVITGTRTSVSDYDVDCVGMRYERLLVEDKASLYATAEKVPQLDILINNAGASGPGGLSEWSPEGFEASLRVNFLSVFHLSQAMLPALRRSRLKCGGSMIGIASMSSYFGMDFVPAYGAAKAALVQHVKTLAVAEAKNAVRINAVAAGLVMSRMTSGLADIPGGDAALMARTPMQRWGEPEEIADAVLFLSSDKARYLTGQTINVDGGFSISG